jgi:hypothetical protein
MGHIVFMIHCHDLERVDCVYGFPVGNGRDRSLQSYRPIWLQVVARLRVGVGGV